ncbi:MAG: hypothetical protein ACI9TH_002023 [Kiritimatiellia bacterium]|jgi:hypothetical protein
MYSVGMATPQQRAVIFEYLNRQFFAIPFFIGGVWLMFNNPLVGISLLMVSAVIVARPLAAVFADAFVEGLFSNREAIAEIPPIYSIAEARLQEGNFEAARERYDAMLESHPHVLKVYTDAFRLAARYMKDRTYFDLIRQRGLVGLKKQDLPKLEAAHESYADYFLTRPEWQDNETVAYRRSPSGTIQFDS